MPKKFNITGDCKPSLHYMVDLHSRLVKIKALIDDGQYFVINRARQYGKTTTLAALDRFICDDYIVFSIDFQMSMSSAKFSDEYKFSSAFAKAMMKTAPKESSDEFTGAVKKLDEVVKGNYDLVDLFDHIEDICSASPRPVVLIIDEVDSASNNQIFLDFLAQLRGCYLNRENQATFRSVILAGVHDVRYLQQKIRPDAEHKHNSPWNIASSFDVDMSFSPDDIAGMLQEYEKDNETGMDIPAISKLIYDYTSGYPVLVSHICKLIDEAEDNDECKSWNERGVKEAVKKLLTLNTPLFESLVNKLEQFPKLKKQLEQILENGRSIPYRPDDDAVKQAIMYGFVRVLNGNIVVSNRIFETRFYDMLLTAPEVQELPLYRASEREKPMFIKDGHLDMELVLEKFVEYFSDIYGTENQSFIESDGRKLFLIYLRPIINGIGNYYIEAETRDHKRTDVIVDYLGEQFIIEMKIWHGKEYNEQGEHQLVDYLESHHADKGYMLTFNFNKTKTTGVKTVNIGNMTIVEAVV